jgi:hypothetical protein
MPETPEELKDLQVAFRSALNTFARAQDAQERAERETAKAEEAYKTAKAAYETGLKAELEQVSR